MNYHTIEDLHQQLVNKEVTAVQLVEEAFRRIDALDDEMKAFITLDKEGALESARAIDEEGIQEDEYLKGIPIAIKDNYLTKGLKTTAASKMLEDFIPTFDATVIKNLKAAGLVIIGKTNMDEFAMGGRGTTSAFQVTANPWKKGVTTGGSSGGSATAVAAGLVPAATGSDTGGSIRQPASFTNLVGVKPSYGRVSRHGIIGMASSLDTAGPMTLSVKDAAALLGAMAGHDDLDMTSLDAEVPDYVGQIEDKALSDFTVGVVKEIMDHPDLMPEVKDLFNQAVEVFKSAGASVKEVSIPTILYTDSIYSVLNTTEGNTALQRFDGIRFSRRAEGYEDLEDLYVKSRTEGFGDEVQHRIVKGMHATTGENVDAYHTQAARVRTLVIEEFDQAFEEVDLLLTPATAQPAYAFDDPRDFRLDDILATSVNIAGYAGISVPMGFVDGLPTGLQIVARPLDELSMFQAAYAYEQQTGFAKETAKGDA